MKKVAVLIALLFVSISFSQTSFTINSSVCSGISNLLTANTGTDVAISYTWSSTPITASLSSPNKVFLILIDYFMHDSDNSSYEIN